MKSKVNIRILISILLIPIIFGSIGCSSFLRGLYGIKKIKNIDENTIKHYALKYNIPAADIYKLDTAYISYLLSLDTVKFKTQIKNHLQPLQALYYDKSGQLISFQINCYAGGFPNLKWNRNKIMEAFPPSQQAPLDSILRLDTQFNYIKSLSQTKSDYREKSDYTVIVYWSKFMGRQSKRFIRYIQNNIHLASEKNIKVIYVNTDNIYANHVKVNIN
ncbi:MAG TPA: hypothetical protein PKN14_09445 [Bacteroidia bacterium]|nr:hypothetical protein [Bacteroidia bacterium]MCE7955859.1 hypothetical protein [Bacteroidetes bacterium CHB6]OQB63436.1 MAG: hypothetical protein BWX95_00943 [Bacteroidetes bacterium ADurb.Bin141]HNR49456.1 hypothetical protein [Bacteroidia bacterium]HNT83081.1 hypothetical protein [Bacteroidia bacterium]